MTPTRLRFMITGPTMNSYEYEYDLIVNIDAYLHKLMAGWAADSLSDSASVSSFK